MKKLLCALCGACLLAVLTPGVTAPLAAEEHRRAVALDFVPFIIALGDGSIGIEGTFEYSFAKFFAVKGGLCFMAMEYSPTDYSYAYEDSPDYVAGDYSYTRSTLGKLHLEGRAYPFSTTLRGAFVGLGYAFALGKTEPADSIEGSGSYVWHSFYGNAGYKFMFKPASRVSFYIEPALIFAYSPNPGERESLERELARCLRLNGGTMSIAFGVAF